MIAEWLVSKAQRDLDAQYRQVQIRKTLIQWQKTATKQQVSKLIARPDTLMLLFLGGCLTEVSAAHSDPTGTSKSIEMGSFLWRLVRLGTLFQGGSSPAPSSEQPIPD